MSRTVQIDIGQEQSRIESEMRKHRDAGDQITAKVIGEKRDFTDDEKKALEETQTKLVELRGRLKIINDYLEATKDLDKSGESRSAEPNKRDVPGRQAGAPKDSAEEVAYREAFSMYVRRGFERMPAEQREILGRGRETFEAGSDEMRDLSAFIGVDGGFLVPTGFTADIDKAEKDYAGVLQAPTHKFSTSTGADLAWPVVSDTSNEGELVNENQATSTTASGTDQPTLGQRTLKSYLFSSKMVLVPNVLLQDSAIDVGSLLAQLLGERLGRSKNRYFTLGNNANQPQGIVNASSLGKTAAGAAAITYGETIDLMHSVDPAYRARSTAGYMFADSTLQLLSKLLDADGRPIWQPSMTAAMANGAPGLLNQKPYWINQSMAAAGSGNKSMLFGDFNTFKIRTVKNMVLVRLAERYAEKFQTAFFAFERCDSKSVDASGGAMKHLVHP